MRAGLCATRQFHPQKQHESVLFAHMSAVVLNDLIGRERLAHSFNLADAAGEAPAENEAVPIVRLKYASWSEQSPDYVQVDSALTLQISHLHFFLNRPAVASLIQVRATRKRDWWSKRAQAPLAWDLSDKG